MYISYDSIFEGKVTHEIQCFRVKENNRMSELDRLIPRYAENKAMLEDYKKICDTENKQIKELMDEGSYEVSGWKATKTITTRETMNEDKLLDTLIKAGFKDTSIIKTKEYVDMDELESAIYKGMLEKDILMEIDKCRESKEVTTLRISKVKENKDGKNNDN